MNCDFEAENEISGQKGVCEMNEDEKKELKIILEEHYGEYMSPSYCEGLCVEIDALLGTKYRRPIKEWINGYTKISDVLVPKIEDGEWSLNEIASRLDEMYPNVPAAALLLFLFEENPNLLSMIIPIAEEECFADEIFVNVDDERCTTAILDKKIKCWTFLAQNTSSEQMKKYQMWQVLLNIPELVPIITYDHILGTNIEMWDDGMYHILAPSEEDC